MTQKNTNSPDGIYSNKEANYSAERSIKEFETEWPDNSVRRTARLELKKQFRNYLKQVLTQTLQQQRTELLDAVRKGVPEELPKDIACYQDELDCIEAKGKNSCRQQLLDHLDHLDHLTK